MKRSACFIWSPWCSQGAPRSARPARRAPLYTGNRIGPLAVHKLRGLGFILSSAFVLLS
ncbi:MAG: hypothetical protein V4754_02585 [Pseudomonadota bacterium]